MESTQEDPDKLPQDKYNEVLTNSIIPTLNKLAHSKTKWDTFKTKVTNAKDIVKFKIVFNLNTPANKASDDKSINIFHYKYNIVEQREEYENKISSIIYCSYRKNFAQIKNWKKDNDYLTSDCGWGCMIRSSQMIFSRGLYRLFCHLDKAKYKKYWNKDFKEDICLKSRVRSILLLLELPVSQADFSIKMKKLYFKGDDYIKNINDCTIKVIPPFSIQTICSIGELYGKSAGEWFSDVTLPQIYNKINESFNIVPNLAVIHFHSTIEHETIILRCFEEIGLEETSISTDKKSDNNTHENNLLQDQNDKNGKDHNHTHSHIKKEVMMYESKSYLFTKTALIFVSVRLGINTIPPEYHNSIKRVFNYKNCIGIIGGKGSSAYYFIGYSQQTFLYLDPHLAQECTKDLGSDTYEVKSVFQLNFSKMQTAFTIGFQFRSLKEYEDIIAFFKEETKNEYPIFFYSEKLTPFDPLKFFENDTYENDF